MEEFTISDETYDEFSSYIASRDFTYETRSEATLDKLIETAKQEKYYDFAQDDLQILKDKLAHDNTKDLNNFQDEIKQFLKEEIAVRYYYQKGRMRVSLEHDSGLDKALNVLGQTELYLSTLGLETLDAHAIN